MNDDGNDVDGANDSYWTMVAGGNPDMAGSREQQVWFRFQQIWCHGPEMQPPCQLDGAPQFWDTFWWSRSPGSGEDATESGAVNSTPTATAAASGFYANLLRVRQWWDAELTVEGMFELSLPSPESTNGTWLITQARHNVILGMITWNEKWGSRYSSIFLHSHLRTFARLEA